MLADEINVRALINDLEPGEAVTFPINRLDYVLSCRTRLAKVTGKRFTSSTSENEVTITREPEVTPDVPGTI